MKGELPPVCAAKDCGNDSAYAFRDKASGRMLGLCRDCWVKIRIQMSERSRDE